MEVRRQGSSIAYRMEFSGAHTCKDKARLDGDETKCLLRGFNVILYGRLLIYLSDQLLGVVALCPGKDLISFLL